MKEVRFLNLNAKKWEMFEHVLRGSQKSKPDLIAELFIQLTDDLSFARTYYPGSTTTKYLNQLTQKAYQIIYRNKKEKGSRFVRFWTTEFPLVMRKRSLAVLYSLITLLVSMLIGIVSTANDDTFVRLILSDGYVNMTLENIKNNDPMAVYKSMEAVGMTTFIAINNIFVSFRAFMMGLFVSVGSFFEIFRTGIMLGAFQTFFEQYGLLHVALRTVWLHGVYEITAIVIAGGAGIVLGHSFLFPGTYKRAYSFRKGASDGLKMMIGIVPLFLIAAFIEGFITRHYKMPMILSWLFIASCLAFVAWYLIIYPQRLYKRKKKQHYESKD